VKAVAILYASCRRGATLGDILLSKVKESMQNSAGNSSSSSGGGETEKKENDHNDKNNSNEEDMDLTTNEGDYPDETTTTTTTTTAKGAAKRIRKGKQRTLSVSSAASLLPPPPPGNTNDSETIDWKEVFECLDHRRFATFGVIHGLIQRVHQYPISCDVGLDSSSSTSTSEGVEAGGGGTKRRDDVVVEEDVVDSGKVLLVEDNMQEHNSGGGIVVEEGRRKTEDRKTMRLPTMLQPQHSKSNTGLSRNFVGTSVGGLYHNTPSLTSLETRVKDEGVSGKAGSTGVPSVTGSMSNQTGGVGNEHQLHDQMQKLSLQVAASMDGTKCDDELCCMYQKPLPQLVELVKKYTRREVVSLYSTSQDHV